MKHGFKSKFYMVKAIKVFLQRKKINLRDRKKAEYVRNQYQRIYHLQRENDIEKLGFAEFLRFNDILLSQKWIKRPEQTRTIQGEDFAEAREAVLYEMAVDD